MKWLHLQVPDAEFLRFAAVTVAGLGVDISLAWGLSVFASAAGFSAGAAFNYLLHELWTFRRSELQLATRRVLRYCAALGATLTTRLAVVYGLSQFLNADQSHLVILLLATVLSFFINYMAIKTFVFRSALQPETTSKGNGS